jgi:hypothetical protein
MGVNIESSKQVHAHSAGCARPRAMLERRSTDSDMSRTLIEVLTSASGKFNAAVLKVLI